MQQLKELYMFLKNDEGLKEYIGSLEKFHSTFLEKTPTQFATSQEREILQE